MDIDIDIDKYIHTYITLTLHYITLTLHYITLTLTLT